MSSHPTLSILRGDSIEVLPTIPLKSISTCVTSPPYWGLRDYKVPPTQWPAITYAPMPGLPHVEVPAMECCLGLESTPEAFVAHLVHVFRLVREALKDNGTIFLNLGDSYAAQRGGTTPPAETLAGGVNGHGDDDSKRGRHEGKNASRDARAIGLKHKDLIGIPFRVAFALQADGWYLRSIIPWIKRNSMPESVQDRPATAVEYFFLLSKSERYYYNAEVIKLPGSMALTQQVEQGYNGKATKDYTSASVQDPSAVKSRIIAGKRSDKQRGHSRRHAGFNDRWDQMEKEEQCSGWRSTRNSDWFFESIGGLLLNEDADPLALVVNPQGFAGAHFATFPPNLIKPCILAGCPIGGTVLDPFGGSGTTAMVAQEYGRSAVTIELNPEYIGLIEQRCHGEFGFAFE
jgi:DNA modification methylase